MGLVLGVWCLVFTLLVVWTYQRTVQGYCLTVLELYLVTCYFLPCAPLYDLPPVSLPVCRWLPAPPRLPYQPLVLEAVPALLLGGHDGRGPHDTLGPHQRTIL